jgi:hypothetical protein
VGWVFYFDPLGKEALILHGACILPDPVVLLFPNFFLDKKVTKSQEKSKCSAAFSGPAPLKHSESF